MAWLPVNGRHDFRTSGFNPRRRNDVAWGGKPASALIHAQKSEQKTQTRPKA